MTNCGIDDDVNAWQGVANFGTGFVELGEVYTKAQLSIGLGHHHNIG